MISCEYRKRSIKSKNEKLQIEIIHNDMVRLGKDVVNDMDFF